MNTTVLVVEDDREINELVGEYLTLENIHYLQATTGKQSIHLALAQHPDALILDLMLPDISGLEVARSLSTRRSTYDVPIIVLSCMCQDAHKRDGFAAGALFYMTKPFLPDDLLMTLRKALDWKAGLKQRPAKGSLVLGADEAANSLAVHQMVADLFTQTLLEDGEVGAIRQAFDLLAKWSKQWIAEHTGAMPLRLEYQIAGSIIEWKMTEDQPGILEEAFFRNTGGAAVAGGAGGGGGGDGGGRGILMSWGASSSAMLAKATGVSSMRHHAPMPIPVAPPKQWIELLSKTGSATFERDSAAHTVRFARKEGVAGAVQGGGDAGGEAVPVEEVGAARQQVGA